MGETPKAILRIDRVAAYFEAWMGPEFPFAKIKIKVLERREDFLAVPNVFVLDLATRKPVDISGLGSTLQEALDDLIERFVFDVRLNTPSEGLTKSNFEWAAPEDF